MPTALCFLALLGPAANWWDADVSASLARAPKTRPAWEAMLRATPGAQRAGAAYLVKYLPLNDLRRMSPAALAENVRLAYAARNQVAWGKGLPREIFLDAVLPHANVTEPRDSMRAEFMRRYLPLVKDYRTPGEAALAMNRALFKDYHVTYNTRRLRTDQSPKETIAQGMATCTGLSVMLVDALRAVGVPARVAGIPSWPGRGGNHTWTEVWDGGRWHYVGAAEPDDKGLDHAWFTGDAATAIKGQRNNAIYAVTYRPTGTTFPMVWAPGERVNAENVTDRYAKKAVAEKPSRLMVEVRRHGQRVPSDVVAFAAASADRCLVGKSFGPQADMNNHLSAPVPKGTQVLVVAQNGGKTAYRWATVEGDTVVRLDLDAKADASALKTLLSDRFDADAATRERAAKLLAAVPVDGAAEAAAWEAYRAAPEQATLKTELDEKKVVTADRTSPYLWREVGTKPAAGWGLVIAMHGGGQGPKEMNDEQWQGMFSRYYHDHPEAGGYLYLALRAPNNEWNGFYDDAISPLVERLIRQFVVWKDVNPDDVHLTGVSHGGYGAFVIGPKIPYRFASIHASAAAPTPGETLGENLRDVKFTYMVGEQDTAYGRAEWAPKFAKQREGWRAEYGGYPGEPQILPGVGHFVPDRDKVAELIRDPKRDPWPKRVVWAQSDDVLKEFYWLEAPKPVEGGRIEATVERNTITLKAEKQDEVALWLDPALVDLSKPVTVKVLGGETKTYNVSPSMETYCAGLEKRGDPRLSAPARIVVSLH